MCEVSSLRKIIVINDQYGNRIGSDLTEGSLLKMSVSNFEV